MRDSGPRRAGLFASMFLLTVGLLIAYAGWTIVRSDVGPQWITTTATVVDVTESRSSDGTTMHSAVYTYTDPAGQRHSLTGRLGTSSRPTIGATTDVAFDPADPDSAVVTGGLEGHSWLIFIGVGALIALVGGVALVRRLFALTAGVGLVVGAWARRRA
ncbi:DUF3592 domain-containing protein [Actinoplanes sp. NPDC051346]|uniref:DUF3592 domain-containing protein n=1 Tax=Actinoplanes sp. NPDC051346 TaxID=3155048 RepID=UPI0034178B50